MPNKVFKTYKQLIKVLRNRGIVIAKGGQGSRVIKALEKDNYYNVINAYKDLFLASPASQANDEKYIDGTDFFEIEALYNFDREIRSIYLKYILKIENSFKSVLAHEFSSLYGYDNYLKLNNFDHTPSKNPKDIQRISRQNHLNPVTDIAKINRLSEVEKIENITRLFGDIQQEVSRQLNKNNQMLTHYMSEYGYIPLWVLVNALTLGKVTVFYLNMKEKDKISIARKFNINYIELHKYMSILGIARNKCAHDERFYDLKVRQNIHTNSIPYFSRIGIPKDQSGKPIMGVNDTFAIAIILKQMLSKSDFNEFVALMENEFKKLSKYLKVITVVDIQNVMGFPEKWKSIKNL